MDFFVQPTNQIEVAFDPNFSPKKEMIDRMHIYKSYGRIIEE